MSVRGIRGATALNADDPTEMAEAVVELIERMLADNAISGEALISILFTATPDLHCAFPAAAARRLDLADVPLICAQEIDVAGAMPRVVRVLMHAETDVARGAIAHVYLRGTHVLRQEPTL